LRLGARGQMTMQQMSANLQIGASIASRPVRIFAELDS
jgi:hypothetical protein